MLDYFYYFSMLPRLTHFSAGTVFRRQILTSNVDRRTEKSKIFLIAVDS